MEPRYLILFAVILPALAYALILCYPIFHDILEGHYLQSKLQFGLSLDKSKRGSDTLLTINDDPCVSLSDFEILLKLRWFRDILEGHYLQSKLPFGMSLDKSKRGSDTLLTISDDSYEQEEGTSKSYRPPYRQNRITQIIQQ